MCADSVPGEIPDALKPSADRVLLVGIGASAGGLQALQDFFDNVPANSGMAFVVVQHLDPDRESSIPELLALHTRMAVSKVEVQTRIEPDRVYVIAPNTSLTVEQGILKYESPAPSRERRQHSIDAFFESLAQDQESYAVAIVLSGTGSDGTLGLRAIKERSGLTIAQEPVTAAYDGMPRSAIMSGLVDAVLPVELMPGRLVEYLTQLKAGEETSAEILAGDGDMLRRICVILNEQAGHDFSAYKPNTLVRRIQRRQRVNHIYELGDYLQKLRQDPAEASALCQEFLIGVTQFFRDTEAFEALAQTVIPEIFAQKGHHEQIRVWAPGCSTGEEAYSIAILISEYCARARIPAQAQVFATDIDEHALETARRGWYPQGIADQVNPERLARHFVASAGLYQVSQSIREMCIFAKHDINRDPPFSQLDLVSCRNLLIYLQNEAQQRLLPVLHYALLPGGYLFLGKSENLASHSDMFETLDRHQHLYRRIETASALFPGYRRASQDPPSRATPNVAPGLASAQPALRRDLVNIFHRALLEDYAPSAVVINEHGAVIEASGATGKYLQLPQGAFENNIFSMARRGLRMKLREAVMQAVRSKDTVVVDRIPFSAAGAALDVRLTARPLSYHNNPPLYMVVFEPAGPLTPDQPAADQGRQGDDPGDSAAQELENELRRTREVLNSTIEELEASNEESKATNEELMSANEELQSTNEELQTSKEELQSVNEELNTTNSELIRKLEELNQANDDIENLFKSTDVATIFLDQDLNIKRFTQAAQKHFPLVDSDLGRPITDITCPFVNVNWLDEARAVLGSLQPAERQIRAVDGSETFMMRILPYRTRANVIDGVVITFVSITDLLQYRQREAEFFALIESSQDAIISVGLEGAITSWNPGAERLYGYAAEEAMGKPAGFLVSPDLLTEEQALIDQALRGESSLHIETVRVCQDGSLVNVDLQVSPIRLATGEVMGWSSIGRDITRRTTAEEERERLAIELDRNLKELQTILDLVPVCIAVAHDPQASRIVSNQASAALFGTLDALNPSKFGPSDDEAPYRFWQDGAEVPVEELAMQRCAAQGMEVANVEYELRFQDGTVKEVLVSAVPLFDEQQNSRGCVAYFMDVTEHRRYERQLEAASRNKDEFLAMLGHELRNPLASIVSSILLLQRDEALEPDGRQEAVGVIRRQSGHLKRLVDDLLDLSRISRGTIQLTQEPVNLASVTSEVVQNYRAISDAAGLNLRLEIPTEPLWVLGDQDRLVQILDNLVSNSCKFTERQGTISISLHKVDNTRLEIMVSDTGVGVSPELLDQLFDSFRQFHTDDRGSPGLGIGLALTKGLVEIHRGSIRLHSEGPGKGFRATVRLPLADPRDHYRAPDAQVGDGLENPVPRRVLIIDDDQDFATSLSQLLRKFDGHTVEFAVDGADGIDLARQFLPDVLICDLSLGGGMGGGSVAQAIRQATDIPTPSLIIALTGFSAEQRREGAGDEVFDLFITKPPDFERLRRIISELSA